MKQIKPQKARGVLKEHMWNDLYWIAEEKYDGDRRISQFCGASIRFTGTRESVDGSGYVEKTGCLPHLQVCVPLRHRLQLAGTVLDGEIIAPIGKEISGGRSKYVTSIMGSKPEEALRKQRLGGFLCYMVFDCLWFKGTDIRAATLPIRRNYAEQAVRAWGNSYVAVASQAAGVGKRAFYDRIVESGGEGVVLKHRDHKYGVESLWVKVKAEATADVVMLGYEKGKGKYAKTLGALVFGQNFKVCLQAGARNRMGLVRLGTCSGFDDSMRAAVYKNPKKYTGKVFRIKHNGREPTGAFRHPRFDGWRDDKLPKDCVYDQSET